MGNFSINHYTGIRIDRDTVELRYIIDLAEIPTYQEVQDASIVTTVGDPTLRPYLSRQAAMWLKNLTLSISNEPVTLSILSTSVIFPPGAGGLPTMKIGVVYRGTLRHQTTGTVSLHYSDDNFLGHAGWKEIVVTPGDGITLAPDTDGTQPFKTDRSAQLTDYPTNLLNSPPQDLEADLSYTIQPAPITALANSVAKPQPALLPQSKSAASTANPATAAAATNTATTASLVLAPNKQVTPRNRFTELMAAPNQTMSFWFLLTAALLAAGLGAAHALEPGHGKTIVAAYLVGSRGRARHAVGLGLLVTASHTAGVYLLGGIVLYASKYIIPERIYPWLSIFSGLIIAAMAGYLFLRAYTGTTDASEDADGVLHSHWYTPKSRPAPTMDPDANKTVPLKQLLILGITGGIIPCPAALVVLLSAVSMHRVGLGLFLIVAFSMGLAAVLIVIGIAMVRARGLLSRWKSDSPWIKRYLPLASSSAMMLAGLAIAATALPATGLSLSRTQVPTFLWIVGLGLFLGMRHSTDPDHVVAVSTIVARERSVKQGSLIGMMWGFGHTITIFVVGALIILFKLTIPPRLGLSMEMTVAAMLILLGILNLTGILQRITQRLTPAAWASKETLPDTTAPIDAAASPPTASQPLHRRALNSATSLVNRFGYFQLLRPLAIGLVHGLAGSAAVALLVLGMIPSPGWAVMYLVIFGLGTVAGMMLMTTAMAVPIALTGKSSSRYLTFASGVVSIGFGLFLVYQIGFVDGLFTSHVHWIPS
jgi:high-affinity nickel-transport protein